jgi:outer membrane protein OmpA-like peptidoglycan-associated protein
MSSSNQNNSGRVAGRALQRLGLALAIGCVPLLACGADAVVTDTQIEQALQPPAKTRGLQVRPKAAAPQMINLNIPFEYNSSELQSQATAQLKQLRSALTSEALHKDRFMVAGHTDGKGSAQYNKQLSMRRAEAVKRYLVDNGVAAGRLQAVGYGSEHLASPDHPEDPSNRRVEIRNLGDQP